MPAFPIHGNGTFTLPGGARFLTGATFTATTAGTVTINAPDGSAVFTAALPAGGSCTLNLLNHPELPAGRYTATVTGGVTGTFTAGNR